MTSTIQFNKTGHDYFIDFLKAFCIISVILAHNLPDQNAVLFGLWGGMQVPLFLLIQTFHSLKKSQQKINIKKILKRIVCPFFIAEAFLLLYALVTNDSNTVLQTIKSFVICGGFGPGAYYFWIYLQFAILLPLLAPVFEKWPKYKLLITFILIGILGEVFCSVVHLRESIFRLLAIRYLFLIYLGYQWVKDGVAINVRTVIPAIISLIAILFFSFSDYNLEPIFYQTNWRVHRWICYFYTYTLLTFLLYQLYQFLKRHEVIHNVLTRIGNASYEIFLFQMCIFFFVPKSIFSFARNMILINFLWIFSTLVICILGGLMLNRAVNHSKSNN